MIQLFRSSKHASVAPMTFDWNCIIDILRSELLFQVLETKRFRRCPNWEHTVWSGLTVASVVLSEKHVIHRTDSFLMLKISCRIWPTRSFEMPTISAISHAFNRWSANTRSWIFITISSVAVVFGAPASKNWRAITLQLIKPILVSPLKE